VQITDFDLHRMWLHEGISGYFVATKEIAFRMQAQGIPIEKIHVSGIPVMPEFSNKMVRHEIALELGIHPEKRPFLLMGGGAGLGCLEALAARLLSLDFDFQLLVLAGKNLTSLAALNELVKQYPGRILAFGFTDQVHRLMACSDLVISKPGGLTASESLALGLPMILNTPIPGQEEGNADFYWNKALR